MRETLEGGRGRVVGLGYREWGGGIQSLNPSGFGEFLALVNGSCGIIAPRSFPHHY